MTVVDFSEQNGREVTSLVQKENRKFHGDLGVPSAIFVKCDVSIEGKSCFRGSKQRAVNLHEDLLFNCLLMQYFWKNKCIKSKYGKTSVTSVIQYTCQALRSKCDMKTIPL